MPRCGIELVQGDLSMMSATARIGVDEVLRAMRIAGVKALVVFKDARAARPDQQPGTANHVATWRPAGAARARGGEGATLREPGEAEHEC